MLPSSIVGLNASDLPWLAGRATVYILEIADSKLAMIDNLISQRKPLGES